MFPFFGGGRDDREWCPYCLRDKGKLEGVGTVRIPHPDRDKPPERQGLFTSPRPQTATKKDADGNDVHACISCKTEVPSHLRLELFQLVVLCLIGLGTEKIKESGGVLIEVMDEAKRQADTNPPDTRGELMAAFGLSNTLYIDEDPNQPEAAAATAADEDD